MPTILRRSRRIRAIAAAVAAFAMLAGPATAFAAGPKGDVTGIVLRPQAGYSVAGTVLLPNGRAVSAVRITLTNAGLLDRASVATDAQGRFRVVGLAPGAYTVHLEPDGKGLAPGWYSDAARGHVTPNESAASPIMVGANLGLPAMRLHTGVTVKGQMSSTRALFGFAMLASEASGDPLLALTADPGDVAFIDRAGAFSFRGVVPGTYRLMALGFTAHSSCIEGGYYATGSSTALSGVFAEASLIRVGAADVTLSDMSAPAGVAISGTIKDTDGNAVEMASISVVSDALMNERSLLGVSAATSRATAGTTQATTLAISGPLRLPRTKAEAIVALAAVRARLARVVAGSSRDERDSTPGISAAPGSLSVLAACTADTDENGVWSMESVPVGLSAIEATPATVQGYVGGWYAAGSPGNVVPDVGHAGRLDVQDGTPPVEMTLATGGSLVIRAVSGDGYVLGASVTVIGPSTASAFADQSGIVRFDGLAPGAYTVFVEPGNGYGIRGYESGWYASGASGNFSLAKSGATPVSVNASITRIRMTVPTGFVISGQVVLPRGADPLRAEVEAIAADGTLAGRGTVDPFGTSGAFEITGLNPGNYRLYLLPTDNANMDRVIAYGGWYTRSGKTHLTSNRNKATILTVGP